MMNTVRDTFSSIGDRGSDIARSFGSGTAHLARRIGDGAVDIAEDIGPRRVLIGLAVAAVAIGGTIMMLRYLRARRERVINSEPTDYPATSRVVPADALSSAGVRSGL